MSVTHIPFKTKTQCEAEYGSKMTPLYNAPAFLEIDQQGNKTIYFNDKTKYWNFYIFHEIAHYLLGHETNSPQNELDADLLACILVAPVENLPTYLKTARDLSVLCLIPIDKAEMYWQEIHPIAKQINCTENNTDIMLEFMEIIAKLKSEVDVITGKMQKLSEGLENS